MRYAEGRRAWGHCERCGFRYLLSELGPDGQQPDLMVCTDCWDPKHPQERVPSVEDPVTLWRPTGDTQKSVANLLVIDYPPFVVGEEPVLWPVQIGIGLRSSSISVSLEEVFVAGGMSLLGLPDV